MDQILFLTISIIAIAVVVTDYRLQRIPNGITYPAMLFALLYHFFVAGQSGLLSSLGGLLVGIAVFFIPYLMGGLGAGDVKFLGALGALTGPSGVLSIALYAAVVGGIYALVSLLVHKEAGKRFIGKHFSMVKNYLLCRQFVPDDPKPVHNGPKLCYGIAISTGTYLYLSEIALGVDFLSKRMFT